MARSNNGHIVYRAPSDYAVFLTALQSTSERYPFALYAYTLMPNHFHPLLEMQAAPASQIMRALLTGYARRFNHCYHRREHVF